jgi:alkylation response protein AidB-like acyl-CoA dehydrogenase
MDALIRFVLEPQPMPPAESLVTWWQATAARRDVYDTPVDRAIAGGACADRLGFAFAAGYSEALRAMVPTIRGLGAFCATEEGGAHPRFIKTLLAPAEPGRYTLTGHKKWATNAPSADALLVVASTGTGADGKNRLRVVRVPVTAPGVTVRAAAASFVPEIPHGEVTFDGVSIPEADVLPGDGYDSYLKPFRTIEDLHVHAAVLGYAIGVARRRDFPQELVERGLALAVAVRALAREDAKAATTHLAIAGLLALTNAYVDDFDKHWSASPDDELARWKRDRMLLAVAGKARAARRDVAWEALAKLR